MKRQGFKVSDPKFIVFTGPMFGSKTTRLLAAVDRYKHQNKKIIAFKPRMDNRYSDVEICSHNGGKIPAVGIETGGDIVSYVNQNGTVDVVAIDEAFMIDGCAAASLELFRRGITVIVSSLQLSATGLVFEEVRDMMPWATKIEICPAVCPITGRDAYYTHRKIESVNEITVGGADIYEPRCWEHHGFMNRKEL